MTGIFAITRLFCHYEEANGMNRRSPPITLRAIRRAGNPVNNTVMARSVATSPSREQFHSSRDRDALSHIFQKNMCRAHDDKNIRDDKTP